MMVGLVSLGWVAVCAHAAALPSVRMGVGAVRLAPQSMRGTVQTSVPVVAIVHGRCACHFCCGGFSRIRYDDRYFDSQAEHDAHDRAFARHLSDQARAHDPQLLGEETRTQVVPAPDALETARAALARGDGATALAALAAVLADEDDARRGEALLLAGFSHAIADDFVQAGAQFAAAYDADANLQTRALDGAAICGSPERLRALAQRASRFAHRSPSREVWTAMAVLVHAQGKEARANALMQRALSHAAAGG